MPNEISVSAESGWRDLAQRRKDMATARYLKDGDYKRGILGKVRVLWLNGDYIRCFDGGIRLFDGKTTVGSLQDIFVIWQDPVRRDAETWTEELVKDFGGLLLGRHGLAGLSLPEGGEKSMYLAGISSRASCISSNSHRLY